MFIIEILCDGEWKQTSHTKLDDAREQWNRFLSLGVSISDMNKVGWTD